MHRSKKERQFGSLECLEQRQLMAADLVGEPIGEIVPLPTENEPAAHLQEEDRTSNLDQEADLKKEEIFIIPDGVIGTWTNVDDGTRGITQIQISQGPDGHQIQAWGSCVPADCDWGRTDLDLLGSSVNGPTVDYAVGSWNPGWKEATITVAFRGTHGKIVDLYNVYTDDTNRENMHERYWLSNDGSMQEIENLGNDNLAQILPGHWVNADPASANLTMLNVSESANGALITQAHASCEPTDCDWGEVSMHGVGSTIADKSPEYAIANYEFDSKTTFVTTRFDGNDLIVGTYNVFDGRSRHSNYYSEDRMWKLGDANHDGHFNSSDLVQMMQAAEYEDHVDGNSSWEEGDFNRDGDFTTSDLVLAFGSGAYEANEPITILSAPSPPTWSINSPPAFNSFSDLIDAAFDDDDLLPSGPITIHT
ncbi:MAG: hypothetical protein GY768_16205 [Planctomycetaceae bacterium]|nr:hypothetical protein [Planctomycetaceae bacterium]